MHICLHTVWLSKLCLTRVSLFLIIGIFYSKGFLVLSRVSIHLYYVIFFVFHLFAYTKKQLSWKFRNMYVEDLDPVLFAGFVFFLDLDPSINTAGTKQNVG